MGDKMIKLSVIVPVCNVEKYLAECIQSLINQTLKDIEIICIDDGSKDSSLEILRYYEAKEPRIKVIAKPNSGYGATMNIGLKTARGEYIGILESDDFAEPDMFEKLYNTAKKHDLDLCRCQYYHYKTSENSNELCDNSWVLQNKVYTPLENKTPFYQAPAIWANIFKKSMIESCNIKFLETPGASYQDTSFAFKLYASAKRFMMIENALLHYRIDNASSSVKSAAKIFYVNKEYKEIKRFAIEKGIYDKVKTLIPRLKFACYRWNHERLTKNLKPKFLFRWSLENLIDIISGNIDKKLFDKKMLKRFYMIALFPYLYIFRRSF